MSISAASASFMHIYLSFSAFQNAAQLTPHFSSQLGKTKGMWPLPRSFPRCRSFQVGPDALSFTFNKTRQVIEHLHSAKRLPLEISMWLNIVGVKVFGLAWRPLKNALHWSCLLISVLWRAQWLDFSYFPLFFSQHHFPWIVWGWGWRGTLLLLDRGSEWNVPVVQPHSSADSASRVWT